MCCECEWFCRYFFSFRSLNHLLLRMMWFIKHAHPQVLPRAAWGFLRLFGLCVLAGWGALSHACWEDAAQRHQVNPHVLVAIAQQESSLNPKAINRNANGTEDIGLMQINSIHLPKLAQYGIGREHLFDACTSIYVGAWLLSQQIHRAGNTWEAIGQYHSATPPLRQRYSEKIYRRLQQRYAKSQNISHASSGAATP
jgi:hypothetical protein